eukprot:m.325783 g.325783  ORF g.325783 m.325783 type:complete len:84 (+) comp16472_c1_seq46:513-764(+)
MVGARTREPQLQHDLNLLNTVRQLVDAATKQVLAATPGDDLFSADAHRVSAARAQRRKAKFCRFWRIAPRTLDSLDGCRKLTA